MLDYIDTFYFVLAFGIGIFLSYIFAPAPKVVIQYPTPDNAGKITYQDDAGICYKYKTVAMQCPTDKSKLKELPIQ